jgi:hypothetical protein
MKNQNLFELVAESDAFEAASGFRENNTGADSDAAQRAGRYSRSRRISFTAIRVMAALGSLFLTAHLQAQQSSGFVLGLDGVDDHLSIAHTNALNAFPLTVTGWFRTANTNAQGGLISKFRFSPVLARSGWCLQLAGGNLQALYQADSESYISDGFFGLDGGPVADRTWHHLAFVVDFSGGYIYVDGALRGSAGWEGNAQAPVVNTPLLLGSLRTTSGFFAGMLDEVTVWNTALSQPQIQVIMTAPLTGHESGLVAYYRFNEGTGTITADSAPAFGNSAGSLNNGAKFVPPITTLAATEFGSNSARLNGRAVAISMAANVWFEWGTTTNYNVFTSPRPLGGNSDFSEVLTGLTAGITYHFRARMSNSLGVLSGADEAFTIPTFANANAGLQAAALGTIAWGDYDNDGRLDLLQSGYTNQEYLSRTHVWRNSGNGFVEQTTLAGVWLDFVTHWGDFNNDGLLDVPLLTRFENVLTPEVMRNTGGGFADSAAFPSSWLGFAAAGDFDNDGRLDLFQAGFGEEVESDPLFGDYYFWQRITRQLWRNTQDGLVPVSNPFPVLSHGAADWGDYDNDGRLDLLLCGVDSNFVAVAQVWRNTGSGFININVGLPGIAYGSAKWGDYDNDGRLDILLAGGTDLRFREETEDFYNIWYYGPFARFDGLWGFPTPPEAGYPDRIITQLWRNTGNGFTNINAGLPGVWTGTVAWGDFDNDGRKDILLAGGTNILTAIYKDEYFSNVTNVQGWPTGFVAQIWRNTTNGFVNVNAGLPGVAYASAAWGDVDNDGRLDVALSGATDAYGTIIVTERADHYPMVIPTNFITQVWRNSFVVSNSPPSAPTGLKAATSNGTVTFSWDASGDAQTPSNGLTYNLRVGSSSGAADLVGPMSLSAGRRLVPQSGNAAHKRWLTVADLPAGQPLYWSVQAVDSGFAASSFAADQSFAYNTVLASSNGVVIPGDANGDGMVDQAEFAAVLQHLHGTGAVSESDLSLVLSNYFPHAFLQLTNAAGLGGPNVTFGLTNAFASAFSVEYSTNLLDWRFLGSATQRYGFTDTNAPAGPVRHYRLRWP